MANWQEDELLLTLHLYCRTAFGKFHHSGPDISQLVNVIGRTSSAVIKKVSFGNFFILINHVFLAFSRETFSVPFRFSELICGNFNSDLITENIFSRRFHG